MSLVIEPTEIQAFQMCPRSWAYRYVHNLTPKTVSTKLYVGSVVHAGLHAYYTGQPITAAMTKYADDKLESIQNLTTLSAEQYDEFVEGVNLANLMVMSYLPWAEVQDPQNFTKVLYTEQSFKVPIPGLDISIAGRMDMIVEDEWGRLWIVDHKTCAQFPDQTILRLDMQMACYIWAAHYLFPEKKVAGVLYNALRKTNPSKARTEVYRRYTIQRGGREVASIENNITQIAMNMATERLYAQKALEDGIDPWFEPRPGQHCGWKCSYTPLCTSTEEGSDTQGLASTMYRLTERQNWLDEGE